MWAEGLNCTATIIHLKSLPSSHQCKNGDNPSVFVLPFPYYEFNYHDVIHLDESLPQISRDLWAFNRVIPDPTTSAGNLSISNGLRKLL